MLGILYPQFPREQAVLLGGLYDGKELDPASGLYAVMKNVTRHIFYDKQNWRNDWYLPGLWLFLLELSSEPSPKRTPLPRYAASSCSLLRASFCKRKIKRIYFLSIIKELIQIIDLLLSIFPCIAELFLHTVLGILA